MIEQRRFILPLICLEILFLVLLGGCWVNGLHWASLGCFVGMMACGALIAGSYAEARLLDESILRILRQNQGCVESKAIHSLLIYHGKPASGDQALGLLSASLARLQKRKLVKTDGRYVHLLYKRGRPILTFRADPQR